MAGAEAATADAVERFGGCLCGAIRFRVTGELRPVVNCHCGMCRRFHGHHGAYTAAPHEALSFIGEARPTWYSSSPDVRRGFCGVCGSSLFFSREGGATIGICAGALDQPTGLTTGRHIFEADKGDYYEV
jgi:hypothetical protein